MRYTGMPSSATEEEESNDKPARTGQGGYASEK